MLPLDVPRANRKQAGFGREPRLPGCFGQQATVSVHHRLLVLAILASASLVPAPPLFAEARDPGAAGGAPSTGLAIKPANRQAPLPSTTDATVSDPLHDAVASVVVVALTEQFDGKAISVNIDDYNVQVSGARERMVSGSGTVSVGNGAGQAIAFGYRTLYDTITANAAYPAITINNVGGGAERVVPNDATLIGELDERVSSALSRELGGRQVWLQLDRIETFESAGRHVRINAEGVVDFGVDGTAPARIEALFDAQQNVWLRVNYQFGGDPAAGGPLLSGR